MEMAAVWVLSHPVTSLIALYLAYLGSLVVYRLYFHPLAKFPGPKYASISRWHEFYYEVVKKGQFTFKVQEYHKRYGRFGSATVPSTTLDLPVNVSIKGQSSG